MNAESMATSEQLALSALTQSPPSSEGGARVDASHTLKSDPPSADLEQMVEDIISDKLPNAYEVAWDLMSNRKLPFALAEKLATAWRYEVDFGYELLSRPDATPEALNAWADSNSLHDIGIIARHPRTTPETLIKLTKHPAPMAVLMAIGSGRLPAPLMEGFVSSEMPLIRQAVAHQSRNPIVLRKLADDSVPDVRLAVASNPATEDVVIRQLASHDLHHCENIGIVLVTRLEDPLLLATFAAHPSVRVRIAVAKNPHTSEHTLSDLARKERFPTRTMFAVLSKRLKDPEALRQFTRKAARPYVTVVPKSSNPTKYKYRIRMQPVNGGGTKLTIFANGARIAQRTTVFRRWFVAVCSPNLGYEFARLQDNVADLRGRIRLYERIIAGEDGALEEYRRALWSSIEYFATCQETEGDPEKRIAAFRLRAVSSKARLDEAESALDLFRRGQHPMQNKLFVGSWHQRREYVRKPLFYETLVDVIEIKVPESFP
jgi:hypothetical protein